MWKGRLGSEIAEVLRKPYSPLSSMRNVFSILNPETWRLFGLKLIPHCGSLLYSIWLVFCLSIPSFSVGISRESYLLAILLCPRGKKQCNGNLEVSFNIGRIFFRINIIHILVQV